MLKDALQIRKECIQTVQTIKQKGKNKQHHNNRQHGSGGEWKMAEDDLSNVSVYYILTLHMV